MLRSSESRTDLLAIVFIVLFFATLLLSLDRISLGEGILVALALCSPSIMFGRGACQHRHRRLRPPRTGRPCMAHEAILKGASPSPSSSFWRPSRSSVRSSGSLHTYSQAGAQRAALTALGCVGVLVLYAIVTWADVRNLSRATPGPQYNAYGRPDPARGALSPTDRTTRTERCRPQAIACRHPITDPWGGSLAHRSPAQPPIGPGLR
jgi:hypothetical protein